MTAILDTNVLVSAYAFPGGHPEREFRLALEGDIEIATSRPLLAELGRVLELKLGWAPQRAADVVAEVARVAVIVEPDEPVEVVAADPTDDRVLEAALAFAADAIVSGDRHLLDLGMWRGIDIVAPAAFPAT